MRQWSEQLDELVEKESYEDALALLETIDKATLPNKVITLNTNLLLQFSSGVAFIDLNEKFIPYVQEALEERSEAMTATRAS